MFGSSSEPIKTNKIISNGTRESQHHLEQQQQRDDNLPLVGRHANLLVWLEL